MRTDGGLCETSGLCVTLPAGAELPRPETQTRTQTVGTLLARRHTRGATFPSRGPGARTKHYNTVSFVLNQLQSPTVTLGTQN